MICQVISRRHNDLCLPSAEDTDVTELYHMTRSRDHTHGSMIQQSYDLARLSSHGLPASHDPVSCDPIKVSHDPMKPSHDPLKTSHDPIKVSCGLASSHDPMTLSSHDMDTSMASLSVFDTTHLGRLGTGVTMEASQILM